MNIGIIHYVVGGTDGVSLEIDKWKMVLENLGHKVFLGAGENGSIQATKIDKIYHHRAEIKRLNRNTFIELNDYPDVSAYQEELERETEAIRSELEYFIREKKIDFLVVQNIWSNSVSPPASIATTQVMRRFNLPSIAHHHDFYWERFDGVALTCAPAIELAEKHLPPRHPKIRHVVINSLAQEELAHRKGIRATVVPNVFDFDAPAWDIDEYNHNFRAGIGLSDNDLMILQATRIVTRKGIESAIDFVRALDTPARRARLSSEGLYNGKPFNDDSRIVLVMAGYAHDDSSGRYRDRLKKKIDQEGIDALFIDEMVDGRRGQKNGHKVYSLWDTYVIADMVTYPSQWEGWGNQFLEALRARLPILVFEYPVYLSDIKNKGFQVISLGSQISGKDENSLVQLPQEKIEAAADQAVDVLTNAKLRQEMVDKNFELGNKHFSLHALQEQLAQLLTGIDGC